MKKSKLILSIAILAGFCNFSTSNAQAFAQGNKVFSAGYGFPNLGKSVFKAIADETNYKATGYGPLHLKFEYGVSDKIGLGLSINHVANGFSYTDSGLDANNNYKQFNYKYKGNSTKFNVRVNFHFSNSDKLDAYWGVGFGYGSSSGKWTTDDPDLTGLPNFKSLLPIGFETTLGARYYFTDNIGAYGEVGLAKSVMQFGLVFKLE